jgi:formyl-CoA transferase
MKSLAWVRCLKEINPKLVMASISGLAKLVRGRDRTSFDIIGQAMSGVMHMTGEPEVHHVRGNYIGDPNAGVHAALAICASLFYRDRTGKGNISISRKRIRCSISMW